MSRSRLLSRGRASARSRSRSRSLSLPLSGSRAASRGRSATRGRSASRAELPLRRSVSRAPRSRSCASLPWPSRAGRSFSVLRGVRPLSRSPRSWSRSLSWPRSGFEASGSRRGLASTSAGRSLRSSPRPRLSDERTLARSWPRASSLRSLSLLRSSLLCFSLAADSRLRLRRRLASRASAAGLLLSRLRTVASFSRSWLRSGDLERAIHAKQQESRRERKNCPQFWLSQTGWVDLLQLRCSQLRKRSRAASGLHRALPERPDCSTLQT